MGRNKFLLGGVDYGRLVPDETVHTITSKLHITDKKHPFCGARLSINNWNLRIDKTTTLIPI